MVGTRDGNMGMEAEVSVQVRSSLMTSENVTEAVCC